MPYRKLRRIARWMTGPLAVSLLVCLHLAAHAADPTCYASVFVDEPASAVYYASRGRAATVPFSTHWHQVEIYGEPNAQYSVVWHMTLRCTTRLGGHVAYVDTDWGGHWPAIPDRNGIWRHYADNVGELSGWLPLAPGVYYACGDAWFTAFLAGGNPDDSLGAAADDEKAFAVVTEAPPPGGGGS